ncbi:MAG: biopolymer transporter ExbD [Mariprofundaceae bacterium]
MQPDLRRRAVPMPNLTPMIDIVFLLLVFFLLTAHFVRDEALPVQLPQAESGTSADADRALEIVLDAQGHVWIGGEEAPPEAWASTIRSRLATSSGRQVRLRGDARADLGRMVRLLDAARQAGAASVEVLARRP